MPGFKEDVFEHLSAVYQTAADEMKGWINLLLSLIHI